MTELSEFVFSTSNFGIKDKNTPENLDIKIKHEGDADSGNIRVYLDGSVEAIVYGTWTKERLAAKPLKCTLMKSQRYLSIGYDLVADHLTMRYQGIESAKLP